MKYCSEDRFGPRDGGEDSLAPWKSKPVPRVRSPARPPWGKPQGDPRGRGSIATPRPPSMLLELEGTHVPAPSQEGCTQVLTRRRLSSTSGGKRKARWAQQAASHPVSWDCSGCHGTERWGSSGFCISSLPPRRQRLLQPTPRAARLGSARRPATSTPRCWEQGASQYSRSKCLGPS